MNRFKTLLLMSLATGLLVGAGGLMGKGWLLASVVFAFAMNLGMYFWSHKLVLRMQQARALEPGELSWLREDVQELASRAGLPMPQIYLVPDEAPNAFATGRNPRHGVVAFTEGILRRLPRRELRGVIAHELSHIKHRDILVATLAAGIAGAISMLANIFQWGALFGMASDEEEGMNPLAALAFAIIAPLGASLIQFAISRSREFMADEGAARLTGDPEGLAQALLHLERGQLLLEEDSPTLQPSTASLMIASPFSTQGLMSWFSTHPPIAVRVERLRAMNRSGAFAA